MRRFLVLLAFLVAFPAAAQLTGRLRPKALELPVCNADPPTENCVSGSAGREFCVSTVGQIFVCTATNTWRTAGGRFFDGNGNGTYDTVYVGDYDADSSLEMSDIDAAVDLLCPSATCSDGARIVVSPGTYAPPTVNPAGHTTGIMQLPSNSWLDCQPGAILKGFAHDNLDAGATLSTVGTDGVSDVRVTGCDINGNLPGTALNYDSIPGTRMGVYIQNSQRVLVTDNYIHHTAHTCLYEQRSTDVHFEGNTLGQCGAWANTGTSSQPCIYLYTTSATVSERVTVANNVMYQCQNSGINTRPDTATDTIRDVLMSGNVIDTIGTVGGSCVSIAGLQDSVILGTTCRNSNGSALSFGNCTGGYRGAGGDAACSVNVTVDGLVAYDFDSGATAGVNVGTYHEQLAIRDVAIQGTGGAAGMDGLVISQPQRNLLVEGFALYNIPDDGVVWQNAPGTVVDEWITMRGLHIEAPGSMCFSTSGSAVSRVLVDGFECLGCADVTGCSRLVTAFTDVTFRNGLVDGNDVGVWAGFRMNGANSRVTFDNVTFRQIESGFGIEIDGDCDDCRFSNILAETAASTNMQGAINLTGATSPANNIFSAIQCRGTTAGCLTATTLSTPLLAAVQGWGRSAAPPATCAAGLSGLIYYDTDVNEQCICNGTSWLQIDDMTTACS